MKTTLDEFKNRRRTIACNFYIFREFFKQADYKNRIMDFYTDLYGKKILARQHWSEIIHNEEENGDEDRIAYLLTWKTVDKVYIEWKEKKIITHLSMMTGIKKEIFTGEVSFISDFFNYIKDDYYSELLKMSTDYKEQLNFIAFDEAIKEILNKHYSPKFKNNLVKLKKNVPLDCLYYFSVSKEHRSIQADDIELLTLKELLPLISNEKCLICEKDELLKDVKEELERVLSTISTILNYRKLKTSTNMSSDDN